ncbi:hypothetical protein DYB30_006775 [Aphanomyces astaci]|uniref:F-box domain-containing protein n=1 Tax=Aphanomyces astaci TaxID=112090 RepID=A0A397C9D8_APHAT|nr:hypothetical protein DYB30_006775 [Aphanomyces astaci]
MNTSILSILWHDEFSAALGLASWLRLSQLSRGFRSAMQSATPADVLVLPPQTPLSTVASLQLSWPLLRMSFEASAIHNHTLDLQSLSHLHALSISRCHAFDNVHALNQLHSVTLDSCDGVVDISGLAAARSLTLRICPHITNDSLSTLTQIQSLTVYRCLQLADFTHLTALRRLSVEATNQHTTAVQVCAPHLEFVRLVLVTYNPAHVAHVPTVELVHSLELQVATSRKAFHSSYACHHSRLTDVTWLANVPHVDVTGSWCLQHVSSLRHATSVNLTGCSAVADVSALANVTCVDLTHCFRVTDVRLANCRGVVNVSPLCHVMRLTLERIPFQSAAALSHIEHLTIEQCWGFQRCDLLPRTTKLNGCGCADHLFTQS